ncbi:glutathione S-transferase, partial [bacterium]
MLKNKNIPTLVTIGPSHYCEKVRWAMDFLNIDFKEESYPPFFHILGTSKLGGRTVPILVTEQGNYKDSTDILKYLDSSLPEPLLYPPEHQKEVEELEELFDIKLGPSARRVAYSHLLYTPEIIFEDFCASSHPFQDSMYQTFFPIFKIFIKKALKVTPE